MFDIHECFYRTGKVTPNYNGATKLSAMFKNLNIWKHSGFSLVELLIAMALLAVLFGIGAPAFIGLSQENTLVEAHNRFVSSIAFTRSEAVSRNRDVVMCQLNNAGTACDVDNTWQDGWVIWVDLDNDNVMDIGVNDKEILRREAPLPAGYTLSATNNNFRNRITFDSNGNATGDGGSQLEIFRLCDPQLDNTDARLIYLNGVGHAWINRTRGITAGVPSCV